MGFVLWLRIHPSKEGGVHRCTGTHRCHFRALKSRDVRDITSVWCVWSSHLPEGFGCCLDRLGSCNCSCVSDLATVRINSLLCITKAVLVAAGIIKEMSGFPTSGIFPTHSQQLEYLVNSSVYGVCTFIKAEGEHMPFLFLLFSNSICISESFHSMAKPFFF